MSTPAVGDRVQVQYTGTVIGPPLTLNGSCIPVRAEDGREYMPNTEFVTVIEPEYEHDTFYQDARGLVYRYTKCNGDAPWQKLSGGRRSYHGMREPVRPLRKLVPES
jgi:hypothetical protein